MWIRKFSCIWELTIASGGIALHVDCLWVDVLCEDKAKRRVQRVLKLCFRNESIFDATLSWYNT